MTEKTFKQVCQCEHCGNEAEMTITCSWIPEESDAAETSSDKGAEDRSSSGKTKGHAVCSHCGSEADMWIDMKESH